MLCQLLKSYMRNMLGCLGIMPIYDDDEDPMDGADLESSGSECSDGVLHGERVDMEVINHRKRVPTFEIDMEVKIELMGSLKLGEDNGRVGVDIVAVLNISAATMSIDEWQYLQETMWFLVTQLSPADRLSIVVFTTNAKRLCPLRLMNDEDAKRGILRLVNISLALDDNGNGNIAACLRKTLRVLKERSHSGGRKQAIILLSDRDARNDAVRVPLRDVPVHVFAFGCRFANNAKALKEIANKSHGGTFSVLDPEDTKYMGNLRLAFSQCFAQLFPVAATNLKLNLITPGEIISVTEMVGGIDYPFAESNVAGSLTLSLVNLYCQQRRLFEVKLLLPEYEGELIDNEVEVDVLQITYSYSDGEESYQHVSPPAVVSVRRSLHASHILSPYVMPTDHYIRLGNTVENYNRDEAEIQPINAEKKKKEDDKKKPDKDNKGEKKST